jgi:uncharacterized damage-inducible protein DinB
MAQATLTEKQGYLASFEREYQTTLKLARAYPADQLELKAGKIGNSARDVLWMLVISQMVVEVMQGPELQPMSPPPAPQTLEELIAALENAHRAVMPKLEAMTEDHFNATMKMPVGPQQVGDVRRGDALWMMLYDTIHHRGQLSVYMRLAGARVPSIYGPSGDEPWF